MPLTMPSDGGQDFLRESIVVKIANNTQVTGSMHNSRENYKNTVTRRWMVASSLIPLIAAVAAYTLRPSDATAATRDAEQGIVLA